MFKQTTEINIRALQRLPCFVKVCTGNERGGALGLPGFGPIMISGLGEKEEHV